MRSGFVSLVGRPNVGKSTLINAILGTKVSIVSDKPQTTRTQIRGVLNRPEGQIVFVDTPGIHRPRTPLGERINKTASDALSGVDVVALVVDATARIGPGDRFVAQRVPADAVVIVNKIDLASPDEVLGQLARAAEQLDLGEYFAVSAATGEGVPGLVQHFLDRLPDGPQYYPDDMITDVPEAFWVAELVREQLLAATHDELPHSIAVVVEEMRLREDRPEGKPLLDVHANLFVERDSQKGIVIGHKGAVLKQVGIAVREQLPKGAFLELFVKVEKDWQRRHHALERLGY